jgi:antitoxin component YwqK of YwqJK toxin-antitoxin module
MKKSLVLTVILIIGYSSLCFAKVVSEYFPNGKLKSVQVYDNKGKLEGPYKVYWPNGRLRSKTIYKHGRSSSTHNWSEKGVRLK